MNAVLLSLITPGYIGPISVKACRGFQLLIHDINNNPMPQEAKVELVNLVNASAVDVLQRYQGSNLTFSVQPSDWTADGQGQCGST